MPLQRSTKKIDSTSNNKVIAVQKNPLFGEHPVLTVVGCSELSGAETGDRTDLSRISDTYWTQNPNEKITELISFSHKSTV